MSDLTPEYRPLQLRKERSMQRKHFEDVRFALIKRVIFTIKFINILPSTPRPLDFSNTFDLVEAKSVAYLPLCRGNELEECKIRSIPRVYSLVQQHRSIVLPPDMSESLVTRKQRRTKVKTGCATCRLVESHPQI